MPLLYKPVLWTHGDLPRLLSGTWIRGADQRWQATGVCRRPSIVEPGDLYVSAGSNEAELTAAVPRMFARGAVAAIVGGLPEAVAAALPPDAPVFQVTNTLEAVKALGAVARDRSSARIIAVTGSVGKTGVKDGLAHVLGHQRPTFASYRNANCGWGVPESLAQLPIECGYAIFEMGMLSKGSISAKARRVRPHIGLITAIAGAHMGHHGSLESIARTKAEIAEGVLEGGTLVLPRDAPFFEVLAAAPRALPHPLEVVTFGRHAEADVRVLSDRLYPSYSEVEADVAGARLRYELGVPGRHWVTNSLAILATARAAGANLEQAAASLASLIPSFRRGERLRGVFTRGVVEVIDDTWNANPTSMRAAFELLAADAGGGRRARRVAVLGDMHDLGHESQALHAALAEALVAAKVDLVCMVGPHMAALRKALPAALRGPHEETAGAMAGVIGDSLRHGDIVLVKGSNAVEMWRVVHALVSDREAARHAPRSWRAIDEPRPGRAAPAKQAAPVQQATPDPPQAKDKAQSLRATAESEWLKALTDDDRAAIAGLVAATLRGEPFEVPARVAQGFSVTQSPVFVGLRRGGALVEQQWIMASDQLTAITQGVAAMREKLGDAAARAIETVELCFAHGVFAADLSTKRDRLRLNSNIYRGLRGLWIEHAGQAALISPTVMLEQNAPFTEIEEAFCQGRGLPETALRDGTVKLRGFDSVQLLVRPSEAPPRAVALTRGTRTIHVSEITRARVDEMQRELGDFLVRNVDAEGRMVYSYHPGLGVEEQVTNNMIRQWMATIALSRTARHRDDAEVFAVAERNIRYNLRHFYRASGKLGLIEHQGSVKLGAVALAALALIEHPARQKFGRTERRLLATIDHLWMDERGAFRCFYKPDRPADSLNNFYPGEALLTWSFLYQETGDKALLDRFTRAVAHYRAWHLDHRNPAFVPWHTQAYYKVWRATRDPALAEWIFEMNDWLLAMQQWDGVSWRDILGRFYNPNIPKYGPPHASSTGVYMEGLIDAFCMARELGDADRQERYRLALVRGLRSVWQLTYKSADELFYVKEPARVRGGVRTCVYDNRIRVDNVQHNLMAILKILAAFGEDDYRHP